MTVPRQGVLLGAAVLLLTVIASGLVTGDGVLTTGILLTPEQVRGVRLVGVLALTLGALGLAVERRRIRRDAPRTRDPSAVGLTVAAGLIVALVLIGMLDPPVALDREDIALGLGGGREGSRGGGLPGRPQSDVTEGGGSLGQGERDPSRVIPGVSTLTEDETVAQRRMRRVATAFIYLLVALALWRVLGRTLGLGLSKADAIEEEDETSEGPGIAPPADHDAALTRLLEELARPGRGPSEIIRLCYSALLTALASVGAARAAEEAPHEHLRRTLPSTGLSRRPAHTLARLHVLDRFGDRRVTPEDGQAARSALENWLADFRAARADTRPPGASGSEPS